MKHVSVSFVPLLLSVRGLFTWVFLCLELDDDDGVKKDQQHHRDIYKQNRTYQVVVGKGRGRSEYFLPSRGAPPFPCVFNELVGVKIGRKVSRCDYPRAENEERTQNRLSY